MGCCSGSIWAGTGGSGIAAAIQDYEALQDVLPGNMWTGLGHNPWIAGQTLPPGLV